MQQDEPIIHIPYHVRKREHFLVERLSGGNGQLGLTLLLKGRWRLQRGRTCLTLLFKVIHQITLAKRRHITLLTILQIKTQQVSIIKIPMLEAVHQINFQNELESTVMQLSVDFLSCLYRTPDISLLSDLVQLGWEEKQKWQKNKINSKKAIREKLAAYENLLESIFFCVLERPHEAWNAKILVNQFYKPYRQLMSHIRGQVELNPSNTQKIINDLYTRFL